MVFFLKGCFGDKISFIFFQNGFAVRVLLDILESSYGISLSGKACVVLWRLIRGWGIVFLVVYLKLSLLQGLFYHLYLFLNKDVALGI